MPINFDSLPSGKPMATAEKGTYYGIIEKAEMRNPSDPAKKPYLNLTIALKNKEGKSCGKIFDILTESNHELVRYKLQRFITALQINITGNFELKDLCKIIQNKPIILDVTREEKEGQQPRSIVDVFTNEIYYPMSEASAIFGLPEDSNTINASDADDAADAAITGGNEEY